MDTNVVMLLLQLMAQKQPAPATDGKTTLLMVGMILTALTPLIAALVIWIKAAAALALGKENLSVSKEIHIAVNSERTAMQADLKDVRAELRRLSAERATIMENQRGEREARHIASAGAVAQRAGEKLARAEGVQEGRDRNAQERTPSISGKKSAPPEPDPIAVIYPAP